eukprot:GGOE01061557.1.p1 GENE.GGOE01061557.1~~GGOE01061557.1.p1  ORF type:complete len:354 (+),score=113.80 GGOE01061557.1:85-1062(+)
MADDGVATQQVTSILMYASSSVGLMFVNKLVLTSYAFPSPNLLVLAQYCCTLLVCVIAKASGRVTYPDASRTAFWEIMPLPLLFLANAMTGLSGTKAVNLPMFTVLRRFSIIFTMALEWYMLRVTSSPRVQASVFLMIFGSFVAAAHDLTFDGVGYTYVLLNDVFTAWNGVVTKQKTDAKKFGEWGVLFHNTLYSVPVILVFLFLERHVVHQALASPSWSHPGFVAAFLLSSALGCAIQYSTVLCTKVNSALTTTVVGCLKNVVVTYVGMLMVDYKFAMLNFIGLNISILGSIFYSYAKLREKAKKAVAAVHREPQPEPNSVVVV